MSQRQLYLSAMLWSSGLFYRQQLKINLEGPRREKARRTQGEGAQASGCLGCSPKREKARRIRGECAQASGCLSRSGQGRHKTQAQPNPHFYGVPENWNRTQHRARSIQSPREPEQCRRGKHRHPCMGQTQCGRNTGSAPHTQRCLPAAPRPPRSRTEIANLNKRSPLPACVRAEIRHRRDGKQKPNKQREPLQKGPVHP